MPPSRSTSYDEVPYESIALAETHPDNVAAIATLFGLTPPPVGRCRVLELGCASGGNLIPMAVSLPEARFVGIDLSETQVETGRATIAALGLTNIDLRAMSIAEVGEEFGRFDYIICHGVYSWVPPPVQGKILGVCARNLAAGGVAYVSYNCYPGWHGPGMLREIMLFHVQAIREPGERVRAARAFLDEFLEAIPDRDGTFARLVREEAAKIRGKSETYVLHEHLEDENSPCYVHEFVARAAGHGLRYVSDARFWTTVEAQPPRLGQALRRWSDDPIRVEQYFDLIVNRRFRRSLLCHDRQRPTPAPLPGALRALYASAPPRAPGAEDPLAAAEAHAPRIREVAAVLAGARPRALAFNAILDRVAPRSAAGPAGGISADDVATALLAGFGAGLFALHAHEPAVASEAGARPVASPLARLQAAGGGRVTNLYHRLVDLSDFDRLVLRQLDGRDRTAVVSALVETVAAGGFTIQQDGQPIRDPAVSRPILERSLPPSLRRLAANVLLLA